MQYATFLDRKKRWGVFSFIFDTGIKGNFQLNYRNDNRIFSNELHTISHAVAMNPLLRLRHVVKIRLSVAQLFRSEVPFPRNSQ